MALLRCCNKVFFRCLFVDLNCIHNTQHFLTGDKLNNRLRSMSKRQTRKTNR